LIPRLPGGGGGVIPGAERLNCRYGARQHVRKNALQHLHQEITITRRRLVHVRGMASPIWSSATSSNRKEAIAAARASEEFERLL
jgi:hypothetical protein